MTTYCGTVSDVITSACPADVTVSAASADEALTTIWEALDPDLRVAALASTPAMWQAPCDLLVSRRPGPWGLSHG
jgi:hypothetical protein